MNMLSDLTQAQQHITACGFWTLPQGTECFCPPNCLIVMVWFKNQKYYICFMTYILYWYDKYYPCPRVVRLKQPSLSCPSESAPHCNNTTVFYVYAIWPTTVCWSYIDEVQYLQTCNKKTNPSKTKFDHPLFMMILNVVETKQWQNISHVWLNLPEEL